MTTSAATRIFLARLSGIGVFDSNGDQVGKVRDGVMVLRTGLNPPRLTGLVVEVQPRRRIFVPMTKVTAIDAGTVIVTGALNLRRFEQRPNETLVAAELLDRTVDLVASDEQVTVLDMAVEQSRTRDWFVTQLFVRRGGAGFRRKHEKFVVDWEDIRGLSLPSVDQPAEQLLSVLESMVPADLANALHDLPVKRRIEVARELEDERLAALPCVHVHRLGRIGSRSFRHSKQSALLTSSKRWRLTTRLTSSPSFRRSRPQTSSSAWSLKRLTTFDVC